MLEILENFRNFGKYKNFVKILEFLEILDCLESLETLENQETSEKEKRLLRLTLRLLTDLYKKRGACSYPRLKKRPLLSTSKFEGFQGQRQPCLDILFSSQWLNSSKDC